MSLLTMPSDKEEGEANIAGAEAACGLCPARRRKPMRSIGNKESHASLLADGRGAKEETNATHW